MVQSIKDVVESLDQGDVEGAKITLETILGKMKGDVEEGERKEVGGFSRGDYTERYMREEGAN